jgi:hypothetical protein
LRIAGAGRQIHEQIIEFAPFHRHEKLLNCFLNHRPAPDHRLIVIQQKTNAHQLYAVAQKRNHLFIDAQGWPLFYPHHQRNARSINIAVQQTDTSAQQRQAACQIHRGRGFADAALAAGHGDNPFDAGQFILTGRRAFRGGSLLADFDVDGIDARQ